MHEHDQLYYGKAQPQISDFEYDQLVKKIEQIEEDHPEWVLDSSPTQRIGDVLTEGFKQVSHKVPMLSLANTYSREEVSDFIKRVHKLLGKNEVEFCAELKMDGVAVSVLYKNGKYARAVTRGNGKKGDDITANFKTVTTLPLELHGKNIPDEIEVRGEAFMLLDNFRALNKQREEEGHEPFANPRNATAGSLKMLNPKEVSKRKIKVIFYGLADPKEVGLETQYAAHQWMQKAGLPSFSEHHRMHCHSIDKIFHFADQVEKERAKLPFEIDGIVIKVDQLKLHPKLGVTGKSPRFAVAYKFAPEQALSKIKDITVQVGRTGVLTPVAELEPTQLAGSTISRATLHNQDEIKRKDIRIGDTVVIEKGGDVIPKVVSVDEKKRAENSKEWEMPSHCPSCNTHVIHKKGEVAVRCPNSKGCPDQKLTQLIFFASKNAMDIEHLGDKIVQMLVEKGLIESFSDIYRLTAEDLAGLEGFKEKSIENLLNSINASYDVPLDRFIFALGIKFVGTGAADILAREAGSIKKLSEMTEEDLTEIEGIGEKTAHSIVTYFEDENHLKEIEELFELGVKPQKPARQSMSHPFSGKTFVLTGTLEEFTRSEAGDLIKKRGGKVSSSVSSKTDYVLAGEDPGSKYNKAKKLGIKVLSESEFKKLV